MRDGPRRLHRDEGGQMILLGAIVLIIAFFALSSLQVNVPRFVEDVSDHRQDPLLDQALYVEQAISQTISLAATCTAADVDPSLDNLQVLLVGHGVRMSWAWDTAPDPDELDITLADGRTSMQWTHTCP